MKSQLRERIVRRKDQIFIFLIYLIARPISRYHREVLMRMLERSLVEMERLQQSQMVTPAHVQRDNPDQLYCACGRKIFKGPLP